MAAVQGVRQAKAPQASTGPELCMEPIQKNHVATLARNVTEIVLEALQFKVRKTKLLELGVHGRHPAKRANYRAHRYLYFSCLTLRQL